MNFNYFHFKNLLYKKTKKLQNDFFLKKKISNESGIKCWGTGLKGYTYVYNRQSFYLKDLANQLIDFFYGKNCHSNTNSLVNKLCVLCSICMMIALNEANTQTVHMMNIYFDSIDCNDLDLHGKCFTNTFYRRSSTRFFE